MINFKNFSDYDFMVKISHIYLILMVGVSLVYVMVKISHTYLDLMVVVSLTQVMVDISLTYLILMVGVSLAYVMDSVDQAQIITEVGQTQAITGVNLVQIIVVLAYAQLYEEVAIFDHLDYFDIITFTSSIVTFNQAFEYDLAQVLFIKQKSFTFTYSSLNLVIQFSQNQVSQCFTREATQVEYFITIFVD